MKSLKYKLPAYIIMLVLMYGPAFSQSLELKWKFYSGDKITTSPLLIENTLFIGSENGIFYALDATTGKKRWQFKTHGYIVGKATVYKNIVFFESSNTFYALNKTTGEELWKYDLDWAIWGYKIDHWDDIRSHAIVHEDVFYVGTSLGILIGLNALDGQEVFTVSKGINAPIRTTPVIYNGNIYFGDWMGKVYCHSLTTQELVWEKATYKKRYYDTFGSITSEMLAYDGKLYFGSRNPQITVFDAKTGDIAWINNKNDSTGGWIIGSPVVHNNTLFMGGSDNFEMFAMDPSNGYLKWSYNCGLNIYTKPVFTGERIIFTAGSAYWYFEKMQQESKMLGGLFILNGKTGELILKQDFEEPIFSSPEIVGDTIFFGSHDGYVYAYILPE